MSTITEILEKLDIAAYLDAEGIDYRETHGSRGAQLNLRSCPFCGGDKWKVFINASSGLGNCFSGSCEKKFNKFSFIKAHCGITDKALFEYIEQVGRSIGWRPKRTSKLVKPSTSALVIPASFPLPIGGRNLKYLENRGIDTALAKYFHLRFCKKGSFAYTIEGKDALMRFDMRVIIPVYDLAGNLVSFQGRDVTGEHPKRYLFPPGFAATGEHLFNGHNVADTKRVIVGEGVFDVMALKAALDEEESLRDIVPIGTFGKHLSVGQVEKFAILKDRGIEEVVMCWDGEVQATDDAIKAGYSLKGIGLKVRIAMLPNGKDPNEVSREEVRRAYYGAKQLTPSTAAQIMMLRRK